MDNNTQENIMPVAFSLLSQRIKALQSGEFASVFQEPKEKKAKEIGDET